MKNSPNINHDNLNKSNQLKELLESSNRSLSLSTEDELQTNAENEINYLKRKVDYYEKHLPILISKCQETTNKFIVFRDFFLNHQSGKSNDVSVILEKMNTFQNMEENSQISNLLEENSQLHINFKRSTDLLKQQKEIIDKLKKSNKELNSFLETMPSNELSNQRVEELEKENNDLQSLYEMMMNETDELNAKNQTLRNQIENYKSIEDKLREGQKSLQQKIFDLEDEIMNLKFSQNKSDININNTKNIVINTKTNKSNKNNLNNNKAPLDISSSVAFIFSEESHDDIQVHLPIQKSECDDKRLIEELEVKSNYLESELEKTTENMNKMIKQNDILKQDHKKHWLNLKNAKTIIENYKEIENILRKKLEAAGIEIPNYKTPVFEEL